MSPGLLRVRQAPGHLNYTSSLGCMTEQAFHLSMPVSVQGASSGLFGTVSLGPNAQMQTHCMCGAPNFHLIPQPGSTLPSGLTHHRLHTRAHARVHNTEEPTSTPREAFAPSTSTLLISRADPKSARPHRAQSSRELHRAGFKCSLSPSFSLLTCKTERCAVFGMDSVRGGP